MPRLNGHEALMAIRADEALRNIPVVILTTSSEEDVRSSTKKMADGFITKPPSYDGWFLIMKSVADRWLQGNRIRRSAEKPEPHPAMQYQL